MSDTDIWQEAGQEDIEFTHGDDHLAGTLSLPSAGGPHPAVLLIHGAGPGDRGGYLQPIRDAFTPHHFAVLSWDRPGIGGSTGNWRRQTIRDQADEALAAVRFLHQRTDIDRERIGLWGISSGGLVALQAAAREHDIAFVIAISPLCIPGAEQTLHGVEHQLHADGLPEEQVQAALQLTRAIEEAARHRISYAQLQATVLHPAQDQPWYHYFSTLPDADTWDYWRAHGGMPDRDDDPAPILARVRCPVLAIFGESDPVLPVAKSVAILSAALARAGNHHVTVEVIPGAEHSIKIPGTDQFAPGYLDLVTGWAVKTGRSRR